MQVIDGHYVKELHCKNDDCRKLLGYENIDSGLLVFNCPRCKIVSVFKIRYSPARELIDTLAAKSKAMKGGE